MSFLRRVGALFSGAVAAQALQLLALPFLSRAYGPQNYGAYGTFAAALYVAGMSATFRYELAIPLPRSTRTARDLALLCVWNDGLASVLVLLISAAATMRVREAWLPVGFPLYLASSAFFVGLFNTACAVAVRYHDYRAVSVGRVVQVVVAVGTSTACARGHMLAQGLMLGNLAGYAAACAAVMGRPGAPRFLGAWPGTVRMLAILRRYKSFAVFNWPQALLDGIRPLGTVACLQHFFGANATGLYHIANQTLQTPAIALSQSISQVYYRDLVDNVGTARGRRTSIRLALVLAALAAIGTVAVWLSGDRALVALLGARWGGVHGVMSSLSISVAVNFVVAPLVFAFHVKKRHLEFLLWGAAYNTLSVGALFLAAKGGATLQAAVFTYALWSSVVLLSLGLRSLTIAARVVRD